MVLIVGVAALMLSPIAVGERSGASSAATPASMLRSHVTRDSSCAVGAVPAFEAFDPVNHYVYVPNSLNNNLSILNGACKLIATVAFGADSEPLQAGFDPVNNRVYVTDYALDRVYEIAGTKLVATVASSSFDAPYGVAFDPGDSVMAVSNYGSGSVAFMSGTSIVGTNTVGSDPAFFAYDPFWGRLLVTDLGSNNVTSMLATDPTDQAANINIPVGTFPKGIAFDAEDSEDYVANLASDNVTVISAVGSQFGSVAVGTDPESAVWDQATLSVDVVSYETNTVSEIQDLSVVRTITGPASAGLLGVEYDQANDRLFVTGVNPAKVYLYGKAVPTAGPVTSGTSCHSGNYPGTDAYDPVNHDIYVPNGLTANISIFNGACQLVATIPPGELTGTYSEPTAAVYDPTNNYVYVDDDFWDEVYVISGTTVIGTISGNDLGGFDLPAGMAFDPGDSVIGVANSGSNTVTFIGTGSGIGSVEANITVGTEPLALAYDPHSGRFLVANYHSDNVTSVDALYPFTESLNINIKVGHGPIAIAYDYGNARDYVVNSESDTVSVINGLGKVYGTVSVGSFPFDAVWDQAKGDIYVTNYDSGTISVLHGMSVVRTITPSGSGSAGFDGIAYDEATDQVFVTGAESEEVYVYS